LDKLNQIVATPERKWQPDRTKFPEEVSPVRRDKSGANDTLTHWGSRCPTQGVRSFQIIMRGSNTRDWGRVVAAASHHMWHTRVQVERMILNLSRAI
jgi:hypothetical protein